MMAGHPRGTEDRLSRLEATRIVGDPSSHESPVAGALTSHASHEAGTAGPAARSAPIEARLELRNQ